jgi:hypothetical protein
MWRDWWGGWFVALYFIVWGLKRWLTYPRIGYVKLGSSAVRVRARFAIVLGVTALAGALMFLLTATGARPQWLTDYFSLLFNGMLSVIVCIVAWWMGVSRFYLYAILIFSGAVVHQWLGIEWPYRFLGAGSIITTAGLAILISFLKKYPIVVEGGQDAIR